MTAISMAGNLSVHSFQLAVGGPDLPMGALDRLLILGNYYKSEDVWMLPLGKFMQDIAIR